MPDPRNCGNLENDTRELKHTFPWTNTLLNACIRHAKNDESDQQKTKEANSINGVACFRHGSNRQVRVGGSIVPAASSFLPYQSPHRPAEPDR